MFSFGNRDDAPESGPQGSEALLGFQLVPLPPAASFSSGTLNLDSDETLLPTQIVPVPTTAENATGSESSKLTRQRTQAKGQAKQKSKRAPKSEAAPKLRVKKASKQGRKPRMQAKRGRSDKGASSRPKTAKRKTCESEDDETVVFRKTDLEKSFSWPDRLMQMAAKHINSNPGRYHLQVFSEFSGAGTAEVAMSAIANASGAVFTNPLGLSVVHQSDWDKTAQTALLNNSDQTTHIFGDIKDVCSDEMKQKVDRKVAVEVTRLCIGVSLFIYFGVWAYNQIV